MSSRVLVVGGGVIGLSCAWRLARCKIPVTVFDAGEAGGEATIVLFALALQLDFAGGMIGFHDPIMPRFRSSIEE